ncbi:hypothetical protein PIB30_035913 [Stylosanthes scabra]|uniref:Uncharacterized protein n=1 Tax=Stylosanthes scabra TaxID=79078 RepID=A0ABU6XBC2_9FABA|nr:hypothetical protein [Stylosanthes scabra]
MAKPSSSSSSWVWFLSVAALIHMCTALSSSSSSSRSYTAIYSFGDSIADTGNIYYDTEYISPSIYTVRNPPYGETFFHHPTGRFSDGRLIIDFLAEQIGVPLLKPYLGIKNGKIKDWNSLEGVNFAFGGATALDISFFIEKGIYDVVVPTNYSMGVQLDCFMELLPSICYNSSSGCKEVLGRSLFVVGEIGGNDFNYLFQLGKTIEEARTYVPLVINKISWAINKLIDLGAQTLVVPGNFAIGCTFFYLTNFPSRDLEDYDGTGCLKSFNNFADYYNKQLLGELNRLQELHSGVTIIYEDYYHATLQLYQSPSQFGFTKSILDSCCPLVNANNHNVAAKHCGEPGLITCNDPSQYISWDGVHLTEAAYKWIAKDLLQGPFTNPKIRISCDSDM